MWTLIRDSLATAALKARYQRLIHERLLQFTETTGPQSVDETRGGGWPSDRRGEDSMSTSGRMRGRRPASSS
jgi:hypothetical protein